MDSDICICIPTLNEEKAIDTVINKFKENGYENILVIDGGSRDNTRQIARDLGVKVHEQTYEGSKGAAIKEAVDIIDSSVIVFVDGDDTYEPQDVDKLINAIQNGADHAIANRFANMQPGAMSNLHIFGNKILNLFFFIIYRKDVKDLLTGYRAITKSELQNLDLKSDGFGIETELTAKSIKNKQNIKIIPSSYYKRKGDSKLQSYKDGFNIFKTIISSKFK